LCCFPDQYNKSCPGCNNNSFKPQIHQYNTELNSCFIQNTSPSAIQRPTVQFYLGKLSVVTVRHEINVCALCGQNAEFLNAEAIGLYITNTVAYHYVTPVCSIDSVFQTCRVMVRAKYCCC
jgi:hypothetical protein